MTDPTGEVTELLQNLIRNRCVNQGTQESGEEIRNADLLATYLEGDGLDLQQELGFHQSVDDEERVGCVFSAGEQLGEDRGAR